MCFSSPKLPDIPEPPPAPPAAPEPATDAATSGTTKRKRDRKKSGVAPSTSLTIPSPMNMP